VSQPDERCANITSVLEW